MPRKSIRFFFADYNVRSRQLAFIFDEQNVKKIKRNVSILFLLPETQNQAERKMERERARREKKNSKPRVDAYIRSADTMLPALLIICFMITSQCEWDFRMRIAYVCNQFQQCFTNTLSHSDTWIRVVFALMNELLEELFYWIRSSISEYPWHKFAMNFANTIH